METPIDKVGNSIGRSTAHSTMSSERQIDSGVDVGSDGEDAPGSSSTKSMSPNACPAISGVSPHAQYADGHDTLSKIREDVRLSEPGALNGSDPKSGTLQMATDKIKYEDDLKGRPVRDGRRSKMRSTAVLNINPLSLRPFATAATPGIVSTVMLRDLEQSGLSD